jgi:hypothetical protein
VLYTKDIHINSVMLALSGNPDLNITSQEVSLLKGNMPLNCSRKTFTISNHRTFTYYQLEKDIILLVITSYQ